nr:hypothetical protein CFP56_30209 [Quercus suber]
MLLVSPTTHARDQLTKIKFDPTSLLSPHHKLNRATGLAMRSRIQPRCQGNFQYWLLPIVVVPNVVGLSRHCHNHRELMSATIAGVTVSIC